MGVGLGMTHRFAPFGAAFQDLAGGSLLEFLRHGRCGPWFLSQFQLSLSQNPERLFRSFGECRE